MGLCRSLRMRRELLKRFAPPMGLRCSLLRRLCHAKILALPALTRLSQTVGAAHGFAPQSPDAARALRRL